MSVSHRARQLFLPMTTLLAAGAIVVASGANFTSTSANAASSLATGSVSHHNSAANAAIFSGSDLKPGDIVTGSVTITNTGTLASVFTLTEVDPTNGFTDPSVLQLTIEDETGEIFAGDFGTVGQIALGEFAAEEARTYTWTATLAADATDAEQSRSASAAYRWDAVQAD